MFDTEAPTSLRYTFKQSLDFFPVTKHCKPNYLIGGLLYNNSLLEENIKAEPFSYLEDHRICTELCRTGYFLKGSELTILRRIEDLVVLNFEPLLAPLPEGHRLAPVVYKLKKQFAYLEKQVQDLTPFVFQTWITNHHKYLFDNPKEIKVDHSIVVERLFNQIELESQRYRTLNKYHLIQEVALEFGLDIYNRKQLYNTWPCHAPTVSPRYIHPLEHLDPQTNYLFDFGNIPEERPPSWYVKEEQDRLHYPITKLQTVRGVDWVKSVLPACTRFVYSDLNCDPEEIRLGWREYRTGIAHCINLN